MKIVNIIGIVIVIAFPYLLIMHNGQYDKYGRKKKKMKLIDRMLLRSLKKQLKSMRKNAKWYEDRGQYLDFYHTTGIPQLENRLRNFESECENYEKSIYSTSIWWKRRK